MARERDKALKELASAELQGRGSRDRRTAGGDGVKGQEIDSEDEDDEDDLQGQVEMLEQVLPTRHLCVDVDLPLNVPCRRLRKENLSIWWFRGRWLPLGTRR